MSSSGYKADIREAFEKSALLSSRHGWRNRVWAWVLQRLAEKTIEQEIERWGL